MKLQRVTLSLLAILILGIQMFGAESLTAQESKYKPKKWTKKELREMEREMKRKVKETRYQDPKLKHCKVHGDSLVTKTINYDAGYWISEKGKYDPDYDSIFKSTFPNARDALFRWGAKKGMKYKQCTSCDKALRAYNTETLHGG